MTTNRFLKLQLMLLVLFASIGVYLIFSIIFNSSDQIQAQNDWAYSQATCRTTGTSCSSEAEFRNYDENSMGDYEMLYCRNFINSTPENGWFYGTWEVDAIEECYSRELCNERDGLINGDDTECNNPYKCPREEPETGEITVDAVCDDDIQISLDVQVSKDNYLQEGTTRFSVDGIPIQPNNLVNLIPQDGSLNDDRSVYPDLEFVGVDSASDNGDGSYTASAGSTVVFRYRNCAPPTNEPERSWVRVRAVCDGNIQLGDIDFTVSRRGTAIISPERQMIEADGDGTRVEFDGRARVDIYTGDVPQSITSQYPDISPQSGQAKESVEVENTYIFEYQNCQPITTTTTITVSPEEIGVVAQCIDGTQEALNLSFTTTEGASGTTPASGIEIQGTSTQVTIGDIPQDVRSRFENIELVGGATERTVNGGSTVTYQYRNCVPITTTTTITVSPEEIGVVAQCIDGTQEALNLSFTTAEGVSGTTPASGIEIQGTSTQVTIGDIPQDVRSRFENIELVGGATERTVNAGDTANYEYRNCVLEEKDPGISIEKVIIDGDSNIVDGIITFGLRVTNTGDVDIENFTLSDNYDARYIEFLDSTYNGEDFPPTATLPPAQGSFRAVLIWDDLPPAEEGVLRVGDTFTIVLRFRAIEPIQDAEEQEDQNCGVIQEFTYTDENGEKNVIDDDNLLPDDCVEYDIIEEPEDIVVDVKKYNVAPSTVAVGQTVRFQAVIGNTSDVTYTDIDFTDRYDGRYLSIINVKITKRSNIPSGPIDFGNEQYFIIGRSRLSFSEGTRDSFLQVNNLQNINNFGSLAPGHSFVLELAFTAVAPISSTCDEVIGDVEDEEGRSVSDRDDACAKIIAPPPPKTGASFLVNFIAPTGLLIAGAVARRFYILRFL
ncbi:MAG: hypothetical protein ACOCXT_02285 [Candidatus Dojkabacteria bacterium]